MAWAYLLLAGAFEVGFASTLKLTDGFTRLWPTIVFLIFAIASFALLAKAAQTLPIGTAYAVWTGIGTVGTVIMLRLFFIATLIASIIGLRYATPST